MRNYEATHQLKSLHKLFLTQYNECLTPTDRAHSFRFSVTWSTAILTQMLHSHTHILPAHFQRLPLISCTSG